MQKTILWVVVVLIVCFSSWYLIEKNQKKVTVNSFETCLEAGYPVLESYPRQCKTPDGLFYTEEIVSNITYNNTTPDKIKVELPFPGAVVGKEFKVIGEAKGFYFEGSFPVQVLDKDGNILVSHYATAQGEWMTSELVPFVADIKIDGDYIGPATLVLHKDNVSDMRELDASISFPITVEY